MILAATLALAAGCLVTAVSDGDTVTVRCAGRVNPVSMRIMEIDAPELKHFTWQEQPYAQESRAALAKLCLNQPAAVQFVRYDSRTGRWIGRVACNGIDVASTQVQAGNAWAYLTSKKSLIPAMQEAAHAANRGLWALPNPQAPNVWRKGRGPAC